MPITTSSPIQIFDQEAFHAVDKVATGIAYELHNEFGRYLDERLYQAELAARLRGRGFDVVREMRITLALDGYMRDYFVDHLVNGGVIIETKTAQDLTPAHRAQLLNYAYLCDLHHATLLNFRTERVQHEFVSTRLTSTIRRSVTWCRKHWEPLTSGCETLQHILARLLADWGSGLDPNLYRDAITHFLGGDSQVIREISIGSANTTIGTQKVHHVADDIGFFITASVHRPASVREHLRRFLAHTNLQAIQWVNLSRQNVNQHTIRSE